jgi:hypothetical protein
MGPNGRRVGLATLAVFALMAGICFVPEPAEWMKVAIGGLMMLVLVGLGVTLYFKLTHMGSFMKREIYPKLVRALTPLAPSLEELKEAKSHLRGVGMALGSKLRPAKLQRALAAEGVQARPGMTPTPLV